MEGSGVKHSECRVLSNLRIRVEDQIAEEEPRGLSLDRRRNNRGRAVAMKGITVSRIEQGRIAEDWTVSDNLGLLRQLGPWRSALVGLAELGRAIRPGR